MKLTDEELIYLRSVARQRWFSMAPFGLDQVSVGLIMKGLLKADIGRTLHWQLTSEGSSAAGQSKGDHT